MISELHIFDLIFFVESVNKAISEGTNLWSNEMV